MDPTSKLISCLYFYLYNNTLNIEKTIKECIEEGAVLHKEHKNEQYITLYIAMSFHCTLNVVKNLKDVWWDNSYFYEEADNCSCCDNDVFIIKYYIDVFLNKLYDNELKHNINYTQNNIKKIKEYAELFNVILLDHSNERHKLIYSHSYKYHE